ncbi:MAG: DUF1559 domain-containing protein [Pirellulales bacterium]|nr:DUF1559 domain-containing protein [Pirellulales bacterium]
MTDDLIAYLLDDLSPERRAAVEEHLATDFAWQREVERLKACMDGGCDPCQCAEEPVAEPPQDLVQKTCFLVEHSDDLPGPKAKSRRCTTVSAFTADSPCLAAGAKPWNLADLTIGGGVLLMVGALVMPALFESRDATRRSVCQNNLKDLGVALFAYQEPRKQQLPAVQPGESAGVYAIELLEHGRFTREQLQELIVCPESPLADEVSAGRVVVFIPTRRQYEAATGREREQMVTTMGGSVAYRIGFVVNRRLMQPTYTGEEGKPLLADAPVISADGVRSANHPRGYNVLGEDLTVQFRTDCVLPEGRDHMYLNSHGQAAAGRGPKDVVLVGSPIGPDGPLVAVEE